MIRGELARRIGVVAVGIPFAVVVVYAGGWVLGVVLAAIAAGAAIELYRLAMRHGTRPFVAAGAVVAALLVLVAAGQPNVSAATPVFWLIVLVSLLAFAVAAIWLRGPAGRPLPSVAITTMGALYPAGTLAYAIFLRHLASGPLPSGALDGAALRELDPWSGVAFVFFPLLMTWINDSCAYFAGRRWGRRRLIPAVSPGKTVVGAVAGVAGTVPAGTVYAALVFELWLGLPIGAAAGAVGGLLLAGAAQVGDLVESLMKREAGVKDSGRLLPGHGGILDRFDALFLTLPIAYWYLALILATSGAGPWR